MSLEILGFDPEAALIRKHLRRAAILRLFYLAVRPTQSGSFD